jgi:hypothetical protein
MKPVRFISRGILLVFLGAAASTYAQQEEAKPQKQEQQAKGQQQAATVTESQVSAMDLVGEEFENGGTCTNLAPNPKGPVN